MSTLGFDKYVEPLKLYLAKYREVRQRQSSVRVGTCGHKQPTVPPDSNHE